MEETQVCLSLLAMMVKCTPQVPLNTGMEEGEGNKQQERAVVFMLYLWAFWKHPGSSYESDLQFDPTRHF